MANGMLGTPQAQAGNMGMLNFPATGMMGDPRTDIIRYLMDIESKKQMTHQNNFTPGSDIMHPLDTAAMSSMFIPGLGDVTGLAADARMFMQEPESRTPLNFGLSSLGLLPFMPSMVKAFHGSPHKFDKFKLDKIGTGEGAQAYGHGLYFAENPAVAGQYQADLARTHLANIPDDVKGALKELDNLGFNSSGEAMRAVRQHDDWMQRWDVDPSRSPAEADAVKKIEARRAEDISGNLYNVKIDVNKEDLLDWDAPLSEQKTSFRKALNNAINADDSLYQYGTSFENTRKYINSNSTGDDLYRYVQIDMGGSQREASKFFRELGIPGIKYLDAGSRGSGGTHNFVIFDDSLIDIAE